MKLSCYQARVCFVHSLLIFRSWPWICRKKPSPIKKSKPPFWMSTMRGCKEDVRHLPRWRGGTINAWRNSSSSASPAPSVTSSVWTPPTGRYRHLHINSPRIIRVAELPAFSSVKKRWGFLTETPVVSILFTFSSTVFSSFCSSEQYFRKCNSHVLIFHRDTNLRI